ncbi:acyl carrier protein [Nitrospirillum viridazoti]|uniref:Acyl carrier protein n=1 Tax=Nitrospirillum amazonense TaxID=28077 RepID=A0A560IIQ6_9PROT|nr:acyl carrier protein [Nitrospirillum amazonense]TWB56660.1 acyl carrier protein [Nitrospirillum amazonense]
MTENEVLDAITPVFRDIFSDDTLTLTLQTTAKDVAGWDSFAQINILIGIEELFGVKFRSREIDKLANVGDLVGLIQSKV